MKIYACKNAIENSKPTTVNTIVSGTRFHSQCITLEVIITHINEIKIFNKMCPDNIFANNRIAKLKTLEIYEIYSIKIKNGTITSGTPSGKNKTKNVCLLKNMLTFYIYTYNYIDNYIDNYMYTQILDYPDSL